jgi:hypothetical protein
LCAGQPVASTQIQPELKHELRNGPRSSTVGQETLFKLITALAFTCSVALGAVRRHLARLLERAEGHQQRMRVIKITVTNGTGHPVTFSADLHDLILGNGNSLTVEFPSESLVQELHSKFSACLEERAHPRSIRRNPWRVPGRGK